MTASLYTYYVIANEWTDTLLGQESVCREPEQDEQSAFEIQHSNNNKACHYCTSERAIHGRTSSMEN
jgi:hypothetical protein